MIVQRVALGILTLFLVSVLIFLSVELLPGDLAQSILGQTATEESLQILREQLNLDRPAPVRYFEWLASMAQGDLGTSLANGRPVGELIGARLGNTLFLAGVTALVAVPIALGLGIMAALRRNTWFDRASTASTLIAISFPEFFIGYVLVLFLGIKLGWFPVISNIGPETGIGERLYRSILPVMTLTLAALAQMMRMTRAAIINLLALPYIEMARLKGASQRRVVNVHALPNAVAPIVNVVALNLAYLITGVVVVEVVFVYPGLGQLLVDSVSKRDIPVVQAACLFFAGTYILLNLLADVLAIVSNPRLLHPR